MTSATVSFTRLAREEIDESLNKSSTCHDGFDEDCGRFSKSHSRLRTHRSCVETGSSIEPSTKLRIRMVVLDMRNVEEKAGRTHSWSEHAHNPQGEMRQSGEQVENPVGCEEAQDHQNESTEKENPTTQEKSADRKSPDSRSWRISTLTK